VCLPDGVDSPGDLVADDLGPQAVLLVAAPALGVPKRPTLADLSRFPWVMNESGCGFRAFLRRRFEAERLPFQVAVEALSSDLRLSLVARGLGIGIVTPAAFAGSAWHDAIEIVDAPELPGCCTGRRPAGSAVPSLCFAIRSAKVSARRWR
jgi:DNA-binding transcriptional LysR family regulator